MRPILLIAVLWIAATANAHTPAEFLEVVSGEPSNGIEHGVEIKSLFDDAKATTQLNGPTHFAMAVGCMGRTAKKPAAYLSWYKIDTPKETAPRNVRVLDLVRGTGGEPLTIGAAEYFLSPAQRIASGPPSEIPEGLDHYKAYRIIDAPASKLDAELTGTDSPADRTIGKPIYLCVAAEEWHHDEYFPATHRRDCFVVYELDPKPTALSVGLIDQFGLNQFETKTSEWLCVRGVISTK